MQRARSAGLRADINSLVEVIDRPSCSPLGDGLPHLLRKTASARDAAPDKRSRVLPRLHLCCYKGDLAGVLQCITEGCSLQEGITLKNHEGKMVTGVTPLFLAAQRGFKPVCKLLIENGAHPGQPCTIQGSGELCTPAGVAQLNLHLLLALYLHKMVYTRKEQDAVLALDDEPPPCVDDDQGSAYSMDLGSFSLFGNGSGRRSARRSQDASENSGGGGACSAAAIFMQELNMERWNPEAEALLDGDKILKLMFKQHCPLSAPPQKYKAPYPAPPPLSQEGSSERVSPPSDRMSPQQTLSRDSTITSEAEESVDLDCHIAPLASAAAVVVPPPPSQRAEKVHRKLVHRFMRGVDLRDVDLG